MVRPPVAHDHPVIECTFSVISLDFKQSYSLRDAVLRESTLAHILDIVVSTIYTEKVPNNFSII